jgi:type II secretory pathway component PulF
MALQLKARAIFYHRLGDQLEAGITLPVALERLLPGLSGDLRQAVKRMCSGLSAGHTLASVTQALPPEQLSAFEAELLAAAEANGRLDRAALRLASLFEQRKRRVDAWLSRLAYPLLLLHLAFLIPTLSVFALQGPDAYLAAVAPSLIILWVVLLLLLLAIGLARRNTFVSSLLENLLWLTPLLGGVRRRIVIARACRALAELHAGGVNTARALDVAAKASASPWLAACLRSATQRLGDGVQVTAVLAASRWLDPIQLGMVETGEQTGKLDVALEKIADHAEHEANTHLDTLFSLGPPLILLLIAAYIGWIVVSSWTEIYSKLLH